MLLPGDLVDGEYDDHGRFEGSVVGLDAQVADMLDTLPQLDGLQYAFILGNHCETYWNKVGANVGKAVLGAAAVRGRSDLVYAGDRAGRVWHGGLTIDMWHPGGGAPSIAWSKLDKRGQGYARGDEPDLLLAGHWHNYGHFVNGRGIHMWGCPTFQGYGSAFGNSIASPMSVGGLIITATPGERGPTEVTSTYCQIE